jgi:hypothetical protein
MRWAKALRWAGTSTGLPHKSEQRRAGGVGLKQFQTAAGAEISLNNSQIWHKASLLDAEIGSTFRQFSKV